MASPPVKREEWLLLKWGSGGSDVLSSRSVLIPANEALVGDVVIASRNDSAHEAATVMGISRDRRFMERQLWAADIDDDLAGPSKAEQPMDFSPSGASSAWEPNDENPTTDDEEEEKNVKMGRYSRSYTNKRRSNVPKPSHRADALNANFAKPRQNKSLPDNIPPPRRNLNINNVKKMKSNFRKIFGYVKKIKRTLANRRVKPLQNINMNVPAEQPRVKHEMNNILHEDNVGDENQYSDRSEDLNRSDDNVLITNKYDKTLNETSNNIKKLTNKDVNRLNMHRDEWIPIGSGNTLIHKDQFSQVKWKSYTVATRTLLLAVFPRRVLATHSLTGKKSPAFQNKPAKMCLDQRMVADVIIEISDRFHVRENLVRSIITTKCADESKMFKARQKQLLKRKTLPGKRNDVDIDDRYEANQTY